MGIWNSLFGKGNRPPGDENAPPPADRDEFLNMIAREGAWLVAREIKGSELTFIDYIDPAGQHVWPLFSTQGTAATWVNHLGVTEVTPFPCVKITPSGVLDMMPKNARVVFDEKSPYERVLTPGDITVLKVLVASGPDEPRQQ
jgi:hypothetical protein